MLEVDGRTEELVVGLVHATDFVRGEAADVYGGTVSGAWVYVTDAAGQQLDGAGQTGEQGEFAVGLPRGYALNQGRMLCAGAPGYADKCVLLLSPDRRYRLTIGAGGTVGGKVIDSSGEPVAGAKIEARPIGGLGVKSYMPEARTWSTMSNTKGEFYLGDVPDEMIIVEAQHILGRAQAFSEVAPGETDYLVLRVSAGTSIEGQVLAAKDERACPNAKLELRAIAMQAVRLISVADEEGRYRFDVVLPGEYEASVECDTMLPQHGIPILIDSESREIDFRLDEGSAVCVEVEPASPPSEKIRVAVYATDPESKPQYREELLPIGLTEHCFRGLSPGAYTISASTLSGSQGSVLGGVALQLGSAGEQHAMVTMEARGHISGQLECGKTDVRVVAQFLGGSYFASNWSDSEGRFNLGPLPAGRYAVRVDDAWFVEFDSQVDPEVVVEVSGETAALKVPCPDPGSTYVLRGQVIEVDGTPVDNVAVSLWVLQGGETRSVYTDHDGRFEFEGVSRRAKLKLYAEAADGRRTPRVRVAHDEQGEHVIRFPEHGTLQLRGGRLGGSPVLVEVMTPGHFRRALTLHEGGSASIEFVPTEPATTVYSYFIDGSINEQRVQIEAGAETQLDITTLAAD